MATTPGWPIMSRMLRPILLADFGRVVGVDADGGEDSRDVHVASSSAPALEAAVVPMAMIWDTPSLGGSIEDAREVSAQPSDRPGERGYRPSGPGFGGFMWWRAEVAWREVISCVFESVRARPQSLQGNCLSILGLLDSPVNVVLNSNPGPGLENLFVGLGPSGAWLAPCAQDVVYLGGLGGSKEVLLVLAHRGRRSEPRLAGRISGGLRLFDFGRGHAIRKPGAERL